MRRPAPPLFDEAVQTVEVPVGAAGVDLKGRQVPPTRDVRVEVASVLHTGTWDPPSVRDEVVVLTSVPVVEVEPRLLASPLAAKALACYPIAACYHRGQRTRVAAWVHVLVASLVPEAEYHLANEAAVRA